MLHLLAMYFRDITWSINISYVVRAWQYGIYEPESPGL